MLKMTKIELELISEIDLYLLIEKPMRGGITYIAKRHCKEIINAWDHMVLINQANLLVI